MTDLEMTRLCEKAMGLDSEKEDARRKRLDGAWRTYQETEYDPLHNDAQAMALVKKFYLDIECHSNEPIWTVLYDDNARYSKVRECSNLNLAIVECVAKMQAQKETA